MPPKPTTFYFVHQIKLETLPYVQKQIASFIQYATNHLSLKESLTDNYEISQWHKKTQIIYSIIQKKLKQIETFHYNNWLDYRSNLVLRSKKLLLQFYQANKNIFLTLIEENQNARNFMDESLEAKDDQKEEFDHVQNIQEQQENSLDKNASKMELIKKSVNRIKTQMGQRTSKQANISGKNVKKVQAKETKKGKGQAITISKQEIAGQLSKIMEKSNNEKPKTNLVFASRRKNESKVQNTKKQAKKNTDNDKSKSNLKKISSKKHLNNLSSLQKPGIGQDLGESVEKQLNGSVQKMVKSMNRSKQKSSTKNVLTKKGEVNGVKRSVKQQQKQKKPLAAGKNMTKEQYIQYLINKNKMNISATKF